MIGAGQLDIGPLRFRLRADQAGGIRYSDPAYAGFFSVGAGGVRTEPRCELPVQIVAGAPAVPAGEPLWRAGGHWAAWAEGADYVFQVGLEAPAAARSACRVALDLSRAELTLGK